MGTKIMYIAHGDYNILSRAKKQIKTLLSLGYNVTLVNGLFNSEIEYNFNHTIITIKIGKSRARIINFYLLLLYTFKVVLKANEIKPSIVICRELTNLPAGVLIKVLQRKRLIFDSNELSVETHSGIGKYVWRLIERICIHYCDEIIHANHDRAKVFINQYRLIKSAGKVHVIENYPYYNSRKLPHKNYSGEIKALYFGSLDINRGLKELLVSVKDITKFNLDLIGFGEKELISELKNIVEENNIENVRFLGQINDEKTEDTFDQYHIGIAFYPNSNLNNWLCAPNKIWQYVHSGLAILCTANPPIVREVEKYKFGECIDIVDAKNLSRAIRIIINDEMWNRITEEVVLEHSWQKIEKNFIKIIEGNHVWNYRDNFIGDI